MAVVVTFSDSNGGAAIDDPVSFGNTSNGSTTTGQVIFVEHDGASNITGCGFYVDVASSYAGDFTAVADKAEILSWGDGASAPAFGGYEINMNASGTFPGASWPTFSNKTTVDGFGFAVRTGVGDSSGNAITIPTVTGATSSGVIQSGAAPDVSFKTRMVIPANVSTTGIRQFRLVLKYTYTS